MVRMGHIGVRGVRGVRGGLLRRALHLYAGAGRTPMARPRRALRLLDRNRAEPRPATERLGARARKI